MRFELHKTQLSVKRMGAVIANDHWRLACQSLQMAPLQSSLAERLPLKRHYIPEWAERSGHTKAALARLTGADKATVTRWFQGNRPQDQYLSILAKIFEADVADIFRHPDDVWVSRFMSGRTREERDRIKATLEAAFPRDVA